MWFLMNRQSFVSILAHRCAVNQCNRRIGADSVARLARRPQLAFSSRIKTKYGGRPASGQCVKYPNVPGR
jgi:hypothetical protein